MRAYYNELDPKAAAWLRELIKRGLIADGDVDETDIRDVDPDRLGRYTQCHFFAGIGGWSLALRLAGWPDDRPVWTGSCPCQPFSAAGRRAGTSDERHLWPHWHHLISQCQPPVVFGEQVASRDGLGWLDLVHADLEATGYAVGAADICAAGIGAPHIRQRLWFVGVRGAESGLGNTSGAAGQWDAGSIPSPQAGEHGAWIAVDGGLPVGFEHAGAGMGGLADASGQHLRRGSGEGDGPQGAAEGEAWQRQRGGDDHRAGRSDGGLADAQLDEQRSGRGARSEDQSRHEPRTESSGRGEVGGMADAMPAGRAEGGAVAGHGSPAGDGICGGLADADDAGLQGRPRAGGADQRTVGSGGVADRPCPTDGHWRDADWLFCRDGKWRPVEPSVQRVADGLFNGMVRSSPVVSAAYPLAKGQERRVMRLRGYGNAIVPQVAATFIRSVM